MFGFGKKKIDLPDGKLTETFEEANTNFLQSIAELQKLQALVKQLDKDLAVAEQSIIAITQALNAMDSRIAALENQLSFSGIKFSN